MGATPTCKLPGDIDDDRFTVWLPLYLDAFTLFDGDVYYSAIPLVRSATLILKT